VYPLTKVKPKPGIEKSVEVAKYSKEAFMDAAKDGKERLLLKLLLDDKTSYSKDEVVKVVKDWKSKEVKS
jgi:alpha-galactosidase/6-phospho-beta-glucosidase family protein